MKRIIVMTVMLLAFGYVIFTQITREQRPAAVELNQLTPAFTVASLNQQTFDETAISEDGIVLNFWATYCPPCVKEMPLLEQAYVDGAEIWAINTGESTYKINHFLSKLDITFPILRDVNNEAGNIFEVMALPTTYFIDGNGIVRKKVTGELTAETLAQGLALIEKE